MEAARAAVSKFTGTRGHQTSVEETVAPAVTHEAIKPHRHEEHTQAVDREVHQHHHHTTVQPLTHQERLEEKHSHNLLPTEHREFHHDDESSTKERLATEMAKFKSDSTTHETHHTQAAAPTVTGEHVHHHVHETVIPVVHKETIQPEVVHTTAPVHETHHAAAQHHGISALPMKSLDEFKSAGGALTGGQHSSHEQYEGAPRPYNDKLSTTFEKLEEKFHHGSGTTGTTSGAMGTTSGVGHHTSGVDQTAGLGHQSSGYDQSSGLGHHSAGVDARSGVSGTHRPTDSGISGVGSGVGSGGVGDDLSSARGMGRESARDTYGTGDSSLGQTTSGTSSTAKKPSLMDRLNPKVDSNGDGKAGFMK